MSQLTKYNKFHSVSGISVKMVSTSFCIFRKILRKTHTKEGDRICRTRLRISAGLNVSESIEGTASLCNSSRLSAPASNGWRPSRRGELCKQTITYSIASSSGPSLRSLTNKQNLPQTRVHKAHSLVAVDTLSLIHPPGRGQGVS